MTPLARGSSRTRTSVAPRTRCSRCGAHSGPSCARFSFRSRDVVRPGASEFDLTVARKLRTPAGEATPAPELPAQAWPHAVAADAASATPTPLREFLAVFGPLERHGPRRLGPLAALWLSVRAGDAEAARTALERDWPSRDRGAALKQALFARETDEWWSLDERTRVGALLRASAAAWDLDELKLAKRARSLGKAGLLPGVKLDR